MLAALAYLENEDRLCRAANDNAAPSARAKLKFRLAAERRFDSQDQIPRYVYDASRKLVHVEDKNPKDGGAAERTDYMSVAGMDIARVITGQGIYYQHTDHLGSTVATTTSSGFLTAKERYTPFGETLDNPGLLSDQGGFTGHIKDSATGLNPAFFASENCKMQARYYDPVIGRFLSIDPQTMLSQNLDPRFFNRYAYTFNDPVNLTDPHGECPWCVALAVIYVADKVYGAYDAAQTAKGIANGTISPVDAAVSQGASQAGGLIAGPIGRVAAKQVTKRAKTFHRLESPSQTPEVADLQEQSGEIWGASPRNTFASDTPTVQAFEGPLPDGAKGVEFTTQTPPSKTNFLSGEARWRAGDTGVEARTVGDKDFAVIKCTVTKNTQC